MKIIVKSKSQRVFFSGKTNNLAYFSLNREILKSGIGSREIGKSGNRESEIGKSGSRKIGEIVKSGNSENRGIREIGEIG